MKVSASPNRLLEHIQWVKDNWDTVVSIKSGIALDDLSRAAEAWFELGNEEKTIAFFADTKGGIFRTAEQNIMRSTEFRESHYGPTETKS